MLSARHRLRGSADFRLAIRGRRAGGELVVVHATRRRDREGCPARVGFVVSRTVGGAVVRNSVKRRLRHCAAAHLELVPEGVDVVVRANPAAADADYHQLESEYVPLLGRVLARLTRPSGVGSRACEQAGA